ncbi:hypothetical protein WR25_11220 [Diploscapter pachys]|uniref:Uncharacterized protein n=1 Tax=Diploscapter pachys TaxID=2018661 RepID=A0A2A2L034_9BILA|nr:hypothetical protein WR25_11220 [Diploscapter pachys]
MTTPDMDLPALETTTMLEDTTTEEELQALICSDPMFMFIYDSCFVSTHIRMDGQCKLQYHIQEPIGGTEYNGYDGSLAACQALNSAAHLWYPTSQAQYIMIIITLTEQYVDVWSWRLTNDLVGLGDES